LPRELKAVLEMNVTLNWKGDDTTSMETPIESSNENLRNIYDASSASSGMLIAILNEKWMNILQRDVTWNEMLSPYLEGT
jgi:hypothetical protein